MNRLVALIKRFPPLYRILQTIYVHTILRWQGSPRYTRERLWSQLSRTPELTQRIGMRDAHLSPEGEFFLKMPDGILLYYNHADRSRVMGDGQSLDFDPLDEADFAWQSIRKLLPPQGTYIDVGANNGYFYALRVAKHFPESRALAFEPNPRISHHLKRNVAINQLGNLEVVETALGRQAGSIYLASGLGASAYTSTTRKDSDWLEVPLMRLDDYLPEDQLDSVAMLKVDIEGGEYDFLLGCERLMQRVKAIFVLEHKEKWLSRAGVSHAKMVALLHQRDYALRKFKGREDILVYPQAAAKTISAIADLLEDA